MGKQVIERDIRRIKWEEDGDFFPMPQLSKNQFDSYQKACDKFYATISGEDRLHYFIVIEDDNVEIIPASKYL